MLQTKKVCFVPSVCPFKLLWSFTPILFLIRTPGWFPLLAWSVFIRIVFCCCVVFHFLFGNCFYFCHDHPLVWISVASSTVKNQFVSLSSVAFRLRASEISHAREQVFCLRHHWEIFVQRLTEWDVEAELCIAGLAIALQTQTGILYAACVSVTGTMHVTARPFSSNSHLGLVTIHLPLRHEWLSSSTDPLFLFREPRGCQSTLGPWALQSSSRSQYHTIL